MKIKTLFDGTEINEKEFYKWLDALNSGEYKQTKGTLQNNNGFCCLGVACKVLVPQELQRRDSCGHIMGGALDSQINSPRWLKQIETDAIEKTNIGLMSLNDCHDFSFEEIASVLYQIYVLGEYTSEGY